LKPINLQQGINPVFDPRANHAFVGDGMLDAPFVLNRASAQSGGLLPLYRKQLSASDDEIRFVDDSGRVVEVKKSYEIDLSRIVYLDDGTYADNYHTKLANGLLFAYGGYTEAGGYLWVSDDDGLTWSLEYHGGAFSIGIQGIVYNSATAKWYMLTSSTSYYYQSSNGSSWSLAAASFPSGYDPVSTEYTSAYILVTNIGLSNKIFRSADGVTYTEYTMPDTAQWAKIIVIDNDRVIITAHNADFFAYSDDSGATFSKVDLLSTDYWQDGVVIGASQEYVYIFSSEKVSKIKLSDMSITEHTLNRQITQTTFDNRSCYRVVAGDIPDGSDVNVMVATKRDGVYYSLDGVNWNVVQGLNFSAFDCVSVSYSNGYYFLLDRIYRSGDGVYGGVCFLNTKSQVYADNVAIGNSFSRIGLSNFCGTQYSDVLFYDGVMYGCKIANNSIVIDIIDKDNLEYISQYASYSINSGRDVQFVRMSDGVDVWYKSGGAIYMIVDGTIYGSIAEDFDVCYEIPEIAGKYLFGKLKISNADGNEIAKYATYSIGNPPTLVASKDGWFYPYFDDTKTPKLGFVGVEKSGSNYIFVHYSVLPGGSLYLEFSAGSGVSQKKSINGMYAEYEGYQKYSTIYPYLSDTSKSGTGADGVNLLGYFSIIDYLQISLGEHLYLRATYNRALKNCDGLSVSFGNRYIGRQFDIANVDFSYRPQLFEIDTYKPRIVYRQSDGTLAYAIFDLVDDCDVQITKISRNKYLANTIDVYALIDTDAQIVYPIGMDYNGAVEYTASGGEHVKIVNDYYETEYNTETGIVPQADDNVEDIVDQKLYYSTATKNYYVFNGQQIESNKFNSEAYLDDHSLVPIPLYALLQNGYCYLDGEIYPLDSLRPLNISFTMQITNKKYEQAYFFYLFGNDYMFDGSLIYLLDKINSDAQIVCRADGLVFLTFTQAMAIFFSYSDSSLYIFDGGRALTKFLQMDRIFPPSSDSIIGDFCAKENSILLSKGGNAAIIHDNKISWLPSHDILYASDNGIYYNASGGGVYQLAYHNYDDDFAAIQLSWQSAFFKNPAQVLSVKEVQLYIKDNVGDAEGTITVKYYAFTEGDTLSEDEKEYAIVASDWDDGGYLSLRYYPRYNAVYGFSVGIETDMDILILDVSVSVSSISQTVIAGSRTR
jgi:hypothetical protein